MSGNSNVKSVVYSRSLTENESKATGVSLECGGLTPLWSRSSVADNKAASSRRTPKRRPTPNRITFLAKPSFMTRSQFRFLVVANQLLLLASNVIPVVTDEWLLPPDLKSYFDMDASVLNVGATSGDVPFWVARGLVATSLIAAIGLCFGKPWGRTLYLLTFVVGLVTMFLWEFYVGTALTPSFHISPR